VRRVRVINSTKQTVLADDAAVAESFWARARGLLGRKQLNEGEGLLLTRTNSIHMFWMAFPLSLVYINRDGKVLRTVDHIAPWRVGPIVPGANAVLELPAGTVTRTDTAEGDLIELQQVERSNGKS
jgi:uncharacterized membrane protein (UPF0127 family)